MPAAENPSLLISLTQFPPPTTFCPPSDTSKTTAGTVPPGKRVSAPTVSCRQGRPSPLPLRVPPSPAHPGPSALIPCPASGSSRTLPHPQNRLPRYLHTGS